MRRVLVGSTQTLRVRNLCLGLLLFALTLPGCMLSEKGGMQRMCDAPLDCEECWRSSAASRQTMLAAHISRGLVSPAARDVFEKVAWQDGASKGRFLRETASASGLERCAWADLFDASILTSTLAELEVEAEGCRAEPECQQWRVRSLGYRTAEGYSSRERCEQSLERELARVRSDIRAEMRRKSHCECGSQEDPGPARAAATERIREHVARTRQVLGEDWNPAERWSDQPMGPVVFGQFDPGSERTLYPGLPELDVAAKAALQACGEVEPPEEEAEEEAEEGLAPRMKTAKGQKVQLEVVRRDRAVADSGRDGAPGGGVRVTLGEPIILGALDRAQIDSEVRSHRTQLGSCYRRGLTSNPTLRGTVMLKFVVTKDGSVTSAAIHGSELSSPAVEDCLLERISEMQFPPPLGGGIVITKYPLSFEAGQ